MHGPLRVYVSLMVCMLAAILNVPGTATTKCSSDRQHSTIRPRVFWHLTYRSHPSACALYIVSMASTDGSKVAETDRSEGVALDAKSTPVCFSLSYTRILSY